MTLMLTVTSRADSFSAVSARGSSIQFPAGGDSDSVAPWVSSDGRYILFSSAANNLTPGDNGQFGLDVFLRDRSSNTTTLVSANYSGTGGGNGSSIYSMLSTNGKYVVFQSDSSDLLPGDTNGVSDIFVRDLQLGTNILVSIATDGGFGNKASTDPVMTPDGRYVAFLSQATNLVAGDVNGIQDVFVRDLVARTTTMVSVGANGAGSVMGTPVITPDGQRIAFFSNAKGLVSSVPATSTGEVYVRDLQAGQTIWASTNAATIAASVLNLNNYSIYPPSYHPVMSKDGNIVAFKTGTNATAGLLYTPAALIFRYDLTANTSIIISSNAVSALYYPEDHVYGPEMSPDGQFIVYVATNKTPGSSTSVQLWEAQNGTNIVVSMMASGGTTATNISDNPFVSADGRFVVFMSSATNLVANVISNGFHIYLRDIQNGTTQLIDADTNGIGSTDNTGAGLAMSADGQVIAFDSSDSGLVGGDNNGMQDVFVYNVAAGTNQLISRRDSSVAMATSSGMSFTAPLTVSDDGAWAAFSSYASDLVPNDTNRTSDIFVRNLVAQTNILVSIGVDGMAALGGPSVSPVISQNGRFVAFSSFATNLTVGQGNLSENIFLHDILSNSTVLISISTNGVSAGNGDSYSPAISQDGRYVAFLSLARNLSWGVTGSGQNTYLRDVALGTTVALTITNSVNAPLVSADGHYVAYSDIALHLFVWDTQVKQQIPFTNTYTFGANVYTNWGTIGSYAFSPSGKRLLFAASGALNALDLASKTNIISIPAVAAIQNPACWSADDRFFVFVTTNAFQQDSNGFNDVYLCDLNNGTISLVSANTNGVSGNGKSELPTISGDGRFVVYRSYATDIVPGINWSPNIFLFDRFTGSNSLLTATSPESDFAAWCSRPCINGDGRVSTFLSLNSRLMSNDLNRAPDVFMASHSPWGVADTDGDGIPDAWMIYYFGHATGSGADQSLATADADGDGVNNLQEYLAGTNPTNASSVFKVQISTTAGNMSALNWSAVPGKSYRLQTKTNLTDAAWIDSSANVLIFGTAGSATDPVNSPSQFYRVIGN